MTTLFRLAIALVALIGVTIIGSNLPAEAGVVSVPVAAGGDIVDTGTQSLVQKVHGCHRVPRIGPWTGIRHRHVGPACIWKKAGGNPCKRWRRICRERCYDARRPKRCKRRCFANNAPGFCF